MLRHPLDYLPILRRHTLTFVKRVDEGDQVYSFIFTPVKPLSWHAGQHGLFTLPGKNVQGKKWRAFSIASSEYEEVVRIGTVVHDEASDFKQKLFNLTPGEKIHMRGPIGEFHFHFAPHVVGIAGGIGITPFRSMLYEIAEGYFTYAKLDLIYGGKDDYWTYKNLCDEWHDHEDIDLIYTLTPEELNNALDEAVAKYGNDRAYFISGSPGMIGALRKKLRKQGIKRIVNDPFKGY